MRHVFIINPTSGVRNYERFIPWIEEYFNDASKYEIFITEFPGHATKIANKFSIRDNVCVYSVGGDGTAYEVLNGLNDGVAMAVIPNGTGDDFHRSIYKGKFTAKDILIKTIEGEMHNIDYGIVNEHRFLNMFCLGFDAMIGAAAIKNSNKKFFPNSLSYVAAVISKITKPPRFNISFQYNGATISQDSLMFAVMNGQYYGGGFNPTPEADIKDGFFDVLMVEHITRRQMIPLIPKYAKGRHKEVKQIKNFKLKDFTLTLDQKMTYTCDGEIFEDDYLVVTMMENRLPFRMPKGSVYNDSHRK